MPSKATYNHPVTGVELNVLSVSRDGKLNDAEHRTAALLLQDGQQRWRVAAQLGCHPLMFNGTGRKPERPRPAPSGANLSRAAAREDPRQFDLLEFFGPERPSSGD